MTTEQQPPKASRPEPPRPRPGNRSAALAVWAWQAVGEPGLAPARESEVRAARREGALRGIVGGVVGTLIFLFWHQTLAFVVWGIAGITFLASMFSPTGAYRWIQKGVGFLVLAVGWLMSWILIPIFFFGFCLVFGLLARRGRKDRMERWFDDDQPSYWKTRNDPPREVTFYERQF